METISSVTLLRQKVTHRLSVLQANERNQNQQWDREKNDLLRKCLISVHRLQGILRKADKKLKPFFEDIQVKDELFKFFYGKKIQIGKYFLLPFFSSKDPDGLHYKNGPVLSLTWDICTSKICFRIVSDLSNGYGEGEKISKNFFSKKDILDNRNYFLQSTKSEKQHLLDEIDSWNGPYAQFVDHLTRSHMLDSDDSFLDRITDLYSYQLTRPEIKKLVYSKRCKEVIQFGCGEFYQTHNMIVGEYKSITENLEKMNEKLLEEGIPDQQKAIVDLYDHDPFDDSHKGKLKEVNVSYIRREYDSWLGKDRNIFAEEYSEYRPFTSGHD